tara:strand:- start:3159 stop:3875 length:717 start_codon:yes stop_codon:yes gene_type:complete
MLARYRINRAKYMKGGNKVEYAIPPKGGFEIPPIQEKHSSMSAALQNLHDQQQQDARIQQEINQSGGVTVGADVAPGQSPPGTVEVEGSTVLDPEQNKAITGIRELQMRAAADEVLDGVKKGGRRKRKKSRKKRKRWPPKKKSRKRKKSKGGDFHISNPKISDDKKKDILKRYHNVTQIGPLPAWNPYNKKFTAPRKQMELRFRHHYQGDHKRYGGKRKKRTRKKKRRRRKKSRRKKR